jgi:hypothetical protein
MAVDQVDPVADRDGPDLGQHPEVELPALGQLVVGQSLDRRALGDGIHQAMVETLAVPEKDRFQIITEHGSDDLIYDPAYLGIERSDDVVLVQVTLSAGRKPKQKREFYAHAAQLLARDPGLEARNLLINLVEVAWENWSFGDGRSQYTE